MKTLKSDYNNCQTTCTQNAHASWMFFNLLSR